MEAKINLHSSHCKSLCEPLSEDICIKSQNIKLKRRRATQPTKTDIIGLGEDKAVEAKAEETDDIDQFPKNSTEINPTDYETTDN